MTPSPYQAAVYAAIQDPNGGNLLVQAGAGSGKTTTIVHAAGLVKTPGKLVPAAIFLAFGKDIVKELKTRLEKTCFDARTFHSLVYTPVCRRYGQRQAEPNKIQKILREQWSFDDRKKYGAFAARMVGLARGVGIGCLVEDTLEAWLDLAERHALQPDVDGVEITAACLKAQQLLALSNLSHEVDFDDLLYRAVKDDIRLPKYDWIFDDEAQDTNAIQRALIRKLMNPGARLVAVGDSSQAIYGFRGADSSAMDMIKHEFSCRELPLTVSYRCATAIVTYASQYGAIEAAPGAVEGEVRDLGYDWKHRDFDAADLVVCRNVKPLVRLGYDLLRQKVRCRILGRDIGEGLKSLVEKCGPSTSRLDQLEANLVAWRDREIAKAQKADQPAKADAAEDRAESLLAIIAELPHKSNVGTLLGVLNELFTDENHRLTLATIHKAKGLEADCVWWLDPSRCPSKWAKLPWQRTQECNLQYVAATRAKRTLCLIEQKDRKEKY